MYKKINTINISDPSKIIEMQIELPHTCPQCGIGIEPKSLTSYFIVNNIMPQAFVLFFCPNCDRCFVGVYSNPGHCYDSNSASAKFLYTFPANDTVTKFSSAITDLSPQFVSIYNQAEKAENLGLSDICGLGYRKALEFLIKDYSITLFQEKEEQIKSQPLVKCIENYIDNHKIKATAKASAWLGNDQTHYVQKHEDYNVKHLKAFINATVSYVNTELSLIEANNLLENPK